MATAPFLAATLDDSDGEHLVVGADADIGAVERVFDGVIDDVRVYTRALSAAEMSDLAYTTPPPVPNFTAGLFAHLAFGETAGTVAADATGNWKSIVDIHHSEIAHVKSVGSLH